MEPIEAILIVIFTVGPALGILWKLYDNDKGRKDSPFIVLVAFGFGFLSVIPPLIIGSFLAPLIPRDVDYMWIYIFFHSFITAGLLEEVSKLGAFRFSIWNNSEFNEKYDGILYLGAVSLGFAAIENIWKSVVSLSPWYSIETGIIALSFRAITAVPAHAMIAGIAGFFIGKAKVEAKGLSVYLWSLFALLIAIIIHGIYDVFALGIVFYIIEFGILGLIISLGGIGLTLIIGSIILLILIRRAQKADLTAGRVGNLD